VRQPPGSNSGIINLFRRFRHHPFLILTMLLLGSGRQEDDSSGERPLIAMKHARKLCFSDERGLPLTSVLGDLELPVDSK